MKTGKNSLQESVVANKIQPLLLVRVLMKYGMWQGTMASGSKISDVK